jgi:WhiB family redox-sensing transcriptional regulator
MSISYLVGVDLDQTWRDDALCAQIGWGDDLWFPEKGGNVAAPKSICGDCPAQAACLEYALDHGEQFGIWGGKTRIQRVRIAQERRRETNQRKAAA